MVGEFVCLCVCVHVKWVSEWECEWVMRVWCVSEGSESEGSCWNGVE